MAPVKTVTLAAALIAGTTSLTMAQNAPGGGSNGMPPDAYKGPGAYQSYKAEEFQHGNAGNNAAASGGSGTHVTSQRTGSAGNAQKVLRNQNGYRQAGTQRRQARRQVARSEPRTNTYNYAYPPGGGYVPGYSDEPNITNRTYGSGPAFAGTPFWSGYNNSTPGYAYGRGYYGYAPGRGFGRRSYYGYAPGGYGY